MNEKKLKLKLISWLAVDQLASNFNFPDRAKRSNDRDGIYNTSWDM